MNFVDGRALASRPIRSANGEFKMSGRMEGGAAGQTKKKSREGKVLDKKTLYASL